MSKNFEQAYKELAQKEAPDLWDRIEAGLTEKSAPKKPDVNRKRSSEIIRILTGRYAGIAAAVLCVAVILPAAVLLRRSGDKSFSGGAATEEIKEAQETEEAWEIEETAEDTAAPEEAEPASQQESTAAGAADAGSADAGLVDTGAGKGTAENVQADLADARVESVSDAEADMADSGALSAAESGMEKEEAGEEDKMDAEEKKMKELNSDTGAGTPQLPAGTVLEGLVVEIKDMSFKTGGDSEEEMPGSICTAVVKEDASGTLLEGDEIEVFVPAHASFFLPVGETCVIDIACPEEGKYPVVQKKR